MIGLVSLRLSGGRYESAKKDGVTLEYGGHHLLAVGMLDF